MSHLYVLRTLSPLAGGCSMTSLSGNVRRAGSHYRQFPRELAAVAIVCGLQVRKRKDRLLRINSPTERGMRTAIRLDSSFDLATVVRPGRNRRDLFSEYVAQWTDTGPKLLGHSRAEIRRHLRVPETTSIRPA